MVGDTAPGVKHPASRRDRRTTSAGVLFKSALARAEGIARLCGAAIEIIVAESFTVSGGPGGMGITERRSA
ncbi:MAG TPA: hypothetical protein VN671_08295, partial [Solirubrobacterales bacterium]|nr:hypothetical protein [Solirubrobacterales bacterium]